MSSKTGYVGSIETMSVSGFWSNPSVHGELRVTVRIDPAPERMTLAELKAAIKPGWWVKWAWGGCAEGLLTHIEGSNLYMCRSDPFRLEHVATISIGHITAARPHDEMDFIPIVG